MYSIRAQISSIEKFHEECHSEYCVISQNASQICSLIDRYDQHINQKNDAVSLQITKLVGIRSEISSKINQCRRQIQESQSRIDQCDRDMQFINNHPIVTTSYDENGNTVSTSRVDDTALYMADRRKSEATAVFAANDRKRDLLEQLLREADNAYQECCRLKQAMTMASEINKKNRTQIVHMISVFNDEADYNLRSLENVTAVLKKYTTRKNYSSLQADGNNI